VAIDLQVIAQRRFELGPGREAGLVDDLADAAIEALHHAVGLRMTWRDQTMFDRQLLAQHVERVLAAANPVAGFRVFFLAGKALGELAAIVGEQLDDGDRTGFIEHDQEVGPAAAGLVSIDLHEDPARGAVNGDEQVTAFGFIGHLRQVLDIHMYEAGLVVLERLFDDGLVGFPGGQFKQAGDTMAAQAAPQTSARNGWIDELTRDRQQVIDGQ